MTQVNFNGQEMSAEEAADIVIEVVEERCRGGSPWTVLPKVLDEFCDSDGRFAVMDAVYLKTMGERLN